MASRQPASYITRSEPGRRRILIDRCVCKQVMFAELLPQARMRRWDLAGLITATGCGAQCGLCRPYLRAMLRDGVTTFHSLLPLETGADTA